jgi:methyltransferase (TIGR00027 family)
MRAAHLLLDDEPKIFRDDFALQFSGEQSEPSLGEGMPGIDGDAANRPGPQMAEFPKMVRAFMIARSRFTEDALLRAVGNGIRAYIILRAGLDSFAWRHPELRNNLRVFEVDHPASQAWKRARLEELGLDTPGNLSFLPMDFERQALLDALREAGLGANQPAFFSWLGVTQYLTMGAVLGTLRQIAAFGPGTQVSFTFVAPPDPWAENERQLLAMATAWAASRGEPWLTFLNPSEVTGQLEALGFHILEHLSPGDANNRYFAARADGLRVASSAHVLLAVAH